MSSLVANFHSARGAMQAGGRNKTSMDTPSCEVCGLQNQTDKQLQIAQWQRGKPTAP